MERFGRIDILVNNAATNPYMGPTIDIDRPRLDKTISVNWAGAADVGATRVAGVDAGARRRGAQHRVDRWPVGGDVDRRVQRHQGRAAAPHPHAGRRARTRRAGQLDRARAGEDRHGPRPVGTRRGSDREDAAACIASANPTTSPAPRRSSAPTPPAGSPAPTSSSTAAPSFTPEPAVAVRASSSPGVHGHDAVSVAEPGDADAVALRELGVGRRVGLHPEVGGGAFDAALHHRR